MPPKKAPKKGKVGLKVGKKGKKKGKKGKKGKYDNLSYNGVSIGHLSRDELEQVAHKVRDHLTQVRAERIRFQLERDFFYDLAKSYINLYTHAKNKNEGLVSANIKADQDVEDSRVINSIKGKHYRYELQFKSNRMDFMNGLRETKLKDELEKYWKNLSMDLKNLDHESKKLVLRHQREVKKLRKESDDLGQYEEEMKRNLHKFNDQMQEKMNGSLKEMIIIDRNENIEMEERYNDAMFRMSSKFEENFTSLKDYYNDITQNTLSLILLMKEHHDELVKHNVALQDEVFRVKRENKRIEKIYLETKEKHRKAKLKRENVVRTKRAIEVKEKEIEMIKKRMDEHQKEYKCLVHEMSIAEDEREYYRNYNFQNETDK